MKKLYLLLFATLLLLSFVTADCKNAILNQPYTISAVCDNCTSVNLTKVTYPNGILAFLGNSAMTQNNTNFNSAFNQTNVTGRFDWVACGNLNGINSCQDTDDRCFYVSLGGSTPLNTAQAIIYILFLFASFGILGFLLFWAIVIPFKNTKDNSGFYLAVNDGKWVKIVCMVMSYIVLMWIFGLLYSTTANYLQLDSVGQFFYYFYYVMLSLLWPVIVCSAIISFIIWLRDNKIKKGIKQHLRMK